MKRYGTELYLMKIDNENFCKNHYLFSNAFLLLDFPMKFQALGKTEIGAV